MTGFALYRLPYERQVTLVEQTEGVPEELPSCRALNGRKGFVMAPFSVDSDHPIVLIRPDRVEVLEGKAALFHEKVCHLRLENHRFTKEKPMVYDSKTYGLQMENLWFPTQKPMVCESRETYGADFRCFYDSLKAGQFAKLVLSRCADVPADGQIDALELFENACQMYPRLFVSLTYTPRSGLWLTATPEILLEGEGHHWHTIALAGTMRLEGTQLDGEGEGTTWSTKNIQEQRYVATYITNCLERLGSDVAEEGPRTARAANLVHLRSDFTFRLQDSDCVGDILQELHPTPAVCGLPKHEAIRFILEHEHSPRQYYSGFMGPLGVHASSSFATHLYVSLRCMQILPHHYRLYAGGGLLKDSEEEQEWQETEAKMETMRALINVPKS